MTRGRKRSRTITVETRSLGPTPERLAKPDADLLVIGGSKQDGMIYHYADALLERVRKRNVIDARQYAALNKFRHHWHHAGLEPSTGSVDMNRVFAADVSMFSGMAKSEKQAFHRQQYRAAVQRIGLRLSHAVEQIVCNDCGLEDYGRQHLDWSHPLQARASATESIRMAGDLIADLWKVPHFKEHGR